MDDKSLLTLAAKAISLILWDTQDDKPGLLAHGGYEPVRWNPLEDDGDALRLAAALELDVMWSTETSEVRCLSNVWSRAKADSRETYGERNKADSLRRTIVRAAARIGSLATAAQPANQPTTPSSAA